MWRVDYLAAVNGRVQVAGRTRPQLQLTTTQWIGRGAAWGGAGRRGVARGGAGTRPDEFPSVLQPCGDRVEGPYSRRRVSK